MSLQLEKHIMMDGADVCCWTIRTYVEAAGETGHTDTGLDFPFDDTETVATMETDITNELIADGDFVAADLTPITWLPDITES